MNEIKDIQNKILRECRIKGVIAHKTQYPPGGWPDLEVYLPDGRMVIIECKTEEGKLEARQKIWIKRLRCLGHEVHVLRSVEEFQELIGGKYGTGNK